MKMKIVIILIIFMVVLLFSYSKMNKEEINYTILGDKELFSNNIISKNFSDLIYDKLSYEDNFGFYSEDFIKKDIRIIDVINQITDNEKIDGITIQNILKRTNILLLNIGNNEINYKLSKIDEDTSNKAVYIYLDDVYDDLIELINIIKNYDDKNIILLGFYNDTGNTNNNKYYEYMNNKLNIYCKKNNITFINLFNILNKNEDYLSNKYITNEGNLAIFNKIYSKIDNLYLHKTY